MAMLGGRQVLVDTLEPQPDVDPPGEGAPLGLSPDVRLSLEVVDDRVAMVLTTSRGDRRVLTASEQDLLRSVAAAPTLDELNAIATGDGNGLAGYVSELVGAGVLVGATGGTG